MSVEVTTTGGTTVSASTGSGTSVSLTASSTSVSVASPATNSVSITSKGPKGDTGATGPVGPEISGGPYLPLSAGSGFPLTGELDMSSNKITDVLAGTDNLDAVNFQQLTNAITGVLTYKGTWDADTNDPTLVSEEGTLGGYYIVSVAGITTLDGISDWAVGDWAVFSDQPTDAWQKIDNTSILGGAGTGGKLPVWTGSGTSKTLGDSVITELSGNIGIGTTNPTQPLHVEGNFKLGGDFFIIESNPQIFLSDTNHNSDFSINLNSGLFKITDTTNSSDRITLDSSGNVGIGTTDPSHKLEVHGDSTLGVLSVKNAANGRDTFRSENAAGTRTFNVGNDGSGHGILLVRNSSGTTTNYITGSGNSYFNGGNVGIGTTSPVSKLHITGETSASLKIQETSGYTGSKASLLFKTSPNTSDAFFKGGILYEDIGDSNAIGKLHLVNRTTADSTNATISDAKITVDNSGNVGIGTTSPQDGLEVWGDIRLQNSNGGNPENAGTLTFSETTGAWGTSVYGARITYNGSANRLDFDWANGASTGTTMSMKRDTGNVGIGTTSPTDKLHVSSGTTGETTLTVGATGSLSNVSSRIFLNEGEGGVTDSKDYGFSLAYDGQGSSYGLPPNAFAILRHDNNATGVSALAVERATGNVGIGTTSPVEKLHVNGGHLEVQNSGNTNIYINAAAGSDSTLWFQEGGGAKGKIQNDASNDSILISDGANADTMTLKGQKVGIGTTAPAAKLDVNGGVRMGDDTAAASATNVGTMRYRATANDSFVEMCMQTGASTYAWEIIKQNTW